MDWTKQFIRYVVVMLLQVLLFDRLQLGGVCHPYIYVLCLLMFPITLPRSVDMLLGAAVGLIMDICCNSLGIHIAACVLLMFIRPYLLDAKEQAAAPEEHQHGEEDKPGEDGDGHRVRQVGRICMDMCMLDITDYPDIRVGDVATVFGKDPTATEQAEKAGTISYELLCAVSQRVPRVYVD